MDQLNSTAPKPFIFVLMPFDPTFDDTYELGIKAACIEAGAYSERLDEQIFHENMLQRVYNQIAKADLIIADMTGRNPNVFYEVGYAHALNKKVVLLTQDETDIPFDLKHYPHIVYKGQIVELKRELIRRVRWFLDQPKGPVTLPASNISIFHRGTDLALGPTFFAKHSDTSKGIFYWDGSLELHNTEHGALHEEVFHIGLISPDDLKADKWLPDFEESATSPVKEIGLPDNHTLYFIDKEYRFPPGWWDKVVINLATKISLKKGIYSWPLSLRLFSSEGIRDLIFWIKSEVD